MGGNPRTLIIGGCIVFLALVAVLVYLAATDGMGRRDGPAVAAHS